MFFIYNLLLLFLGIPFLLLALLFSKRFRFKIGQRLGRLSEPIPANPLWIHASSVGEVKIALSLAESLKEKHPHSAVFLTTFTDSGYSLAAKKRTRIDSLALLPLDFPGIIAPFIRKIKPKILVLIETELWPNLLKYTREAGAPILLLNGRISSRSFKKYFRYKFFINRILSFFSDLSVRTLKDYEYLINLGVDPEKLVVSGNIKYDQVIRNKESINPEKIREKLGLEKDIRVIVFASTREGEEEILSGIFLRLKGRYPDLRIILAPRHIGRLGEITKILQGHSLPSFLFSRLGTGTWKQEEILIVDTLGELFALFSVSSITFVGGSLKPFGGQNMLEPAVFAQPVIFGKFVTNFQAEADLLLGNGGGFVTPDPETLYQSFCRLLDNPEERKKAGEAAFQAVINNAGALEKSINLIERYL